MNERWNSGSVSIPQLDTTSDRNLLDLHLAAIEYSLVSPITIKNRDDIKSAQHWSAHLEPFEHQVRNLITFCRRAPVALIADDVGLGKTISAGLIISELMTRKKVQRVLIIAPKILLPQWKEELHAKFGIEAGFGSGRDLDYLLRSDIPVVVTTYETARDKMEALSKGFFGMLVLDEAHKLRNLHGAGQPPRTAQVIHKALQNRDFKYVVMLTATPIQNRLWDVYSLIDCLATARGHANPLGTPAYFAAYYLADSAATARELHSGRRADFKARVGDYMMRVSRRDSNLVFPERTVKTIGCNASSGELAMSRLVSESLPGLNALARTSLAEALMSSPAALVAQLKGMSEKGTVPPSVYQRAVALKDAAGVGCKLEQLRVIVASLAKEHGSDWRAVLFTRRKETQELIGRTLLAEGVRVGFVRGGEASENQRSIQGLRSDPPAINLLVSTDAGSEGINLQAANIVINFDLPWNPMVVEQRIGRVQRLASKHLYIVVINLVVAGSVEELVVARLIAKLQAVSETIGDVESILESTAAGDGELEDGIADLVIKALMGQDVTAATERIRKSIDNAKAEYEKERGEVEKNLGSLDAMHTAGPRLPELEAVDPRFAEADFVHKALSADGAALSQLPDGRWMAEVPGRSPFVVTFNEDDPDLRPDPFLRGLGRRAELHSQGRPPFERLVGAWSKRSSAFVFDARNEDTSVVADTLNEWAVSLGIPAEVSSWTVERRTRKFGGQLTVRGSAAVAHDRYEKLVTVNVGPDVDISNIHSSGEWQTVDESVDVVSLLGDADGIVRDSVGLDPSIAGFCEFYDARGIEEFNKARDDVRRAELVKSHFTTALSAEVVAADGYLYEELTGFADLLVDGHGPYRIDLTIVPSLSQIVSEPVRGTCEMTNATVPTECLGLCAISGKNVLAHLLQPSQRTGRRALPEFLGACSASELRLLSDELGHSDISQKLFDLRLLKTSDVSGRRGTDNEIGTCEFTQASALLEELALSSVTGKRYRADQSAASAVSSVRGHVSEFVRCSQTGDWMLETESGRSSVTGKVVRPDLLIASEKSSWRSGLSSELARCAASGKQMLIDEVATSSVSGLTVDRDLLVPSKVSGSLAMPSEMIRCAVSGVTLLPKETAICDATKQRVDTRLLETSEISGKQVQSTLLIRCEETNIPALESELAKCGETGELVDPRLLVPCTVTGLSVLRRLAIQCPATGKMLLRTKAAQTQSGTLAHPECVETCAWTGWTLLPADAGRCSMTDAVLARIWINRTGASLVHRAIVHRILSNTVADEEGAEIVAATLAKAGHNVVRVFTRPSGTSSTVAAIAEIRGFLGLSRKYVGCFVDLATARIVGRVSPIDLKEKTWA